jgi:prepilin-type processing-associated H-X9-DG protein
MKPIGTWQRSILGFYIDAAGELRVVTMDGNFGEPTILFADGHVERFEERWETLEKYEKQLIAEGQERRLVGAGE